MSILTMCPSSEWYELDLEDDDEDDQPVRPAEVLTTSTLGGWWSASLELPDQD